MLINQDFSVDRSTVIGGSDIGAILGISKFKTAIELWREKTGKDVSNKSSLPMRFGSYCEEFIASEYSRATGFELLNDPCAHIHPVHKFMCGNIDRFVLGDGNSALPTKILECKTANAFSQSEWGDVGSDEVPLTYLAQVAWYQAITDIDNADLAVLFSNSDFRIYQIERDINLEELIIQKAAYFWSEYVCKDIPPPLASERDCHLLFSKGDASKIIEAQKETLDLIRHLHKLNAEIAEREQEVSAAKREIMGVMGNAETLCIGGKVLATWKAPKQSYRLDSKRLEAEHPEIASAYKLPVQNSRRLVVRHCEKGMI